jgi:glycosyltransferase involved in cell wall biosynthesis
MAPSLSLVLPFYMQGDHADQVVREYAAALRVLPGPVELILVPNGTADETAAVCRRVAAEMTDVKVVELQAGGWGRAVKTGLAAAEGDLVAYTNSARTEAAQLVLMSLYATAYPDVVVKANRRIRDSWRRRLGSVLYNLECRALFDLPTWDINGTPKVFPRKFDRLLHIRADDDLFDAEFVAVCQREGYPVIEVPILSTVRRSGRSTTNYMSALRMYLGAVALRRRLG